jgi:hypothetical protein
MLPSRSIRDCRALRCADRYADALELRRCRPTWRIETSIWHLASILSMCTDPRARTTSRTSFVRADERRQAWLGSNEPQFTADQKVIRALGHGCARRNPPLRDVARSLQKANAWSIFTVKCLAKMTLLTRPTVPACPGLPLANERGCWTTSSVAEGRRRVASPRSRFRIQHIEEGQQTRTLKQGERGSDDQEYAKGEVEDAFIRCAERDEAKADAYGQPRSIDGESDADADDYLCDEIRA